VSQIRADLASQQPIERQRWQNSTRRIFSQDQKNSSGGAGHKSLLFFRALPVD